MKVDIKDTGKMDEEKKESHLEAALPQRRHSSIPHGNSNSAENMSNKISQLLKNNNEKERRENYWKKDELKTVFHDLVQAANVKEKAIEDTQNRLDYESFHERAKDLLTLYYLNLQNVEKANERNEITKLINNLSGDIGKCKQTKFQNKVNLTSEEKKLNKALDTIEDMLKHALKVKAFEK